MISKKFGNCPNTLESINMISKKVGNNSKIIGINSKKDGIISKYLGSIPNNLESIINKYYQKSWNISKIFGIISEKLQKILIQSNIIILYHLILVVKDLNSLSLVSRTL